MGTPATACLKSFPALKATTRRGGIAAVDPTVPGHINVPQAAPATTTTTPVATWAVGGDFFVLPVRTIMLQESSVIWILSLSLA
jgi:hypothetical protein